MLSLLSMKQKQNLLNQQHVSAGRCVNACPMNLMPTKLEAATIYKRVDDLKKYSVMTCMECGCCAFVCPANRKLVQSMRIGKAILRNAGK